MEHQLEFLIYCLEKTKLNTMENLESIGNVKDTVLKQISDNLKKNLHQIDIFITDIKKLKHRLVLAKKSYRQLKNDSIMTAIRQLKILDIHPVSLLKNIEDDPEKILRYAVMIGFSRHNIDEKIEYSDLGYGTLQEKAKQLIIRSFLLMEDTERVIDWAISAQQVIVAETEIFKSEDRYCPSTQCNSHRGACFEYTTADFQAEFYYLNDILEQIKEADENVRESPLIQEIILIRGFIDLIRHGTDIDEQIWEDMREFISCNSQPIIDRINSVEGYVNSVLRVLYGFQRMLNALLTEEALESAVPFTKDLSPVVKLIVERIIRKLVSINIIPRETDQSKKVLIIEILTDIKDGKWDAKILGDIWQWVEETIKGWIEDYARDTVENRIIIKLIQQIFRKKCHAVATFQVIDDVYEFLVTLGKIETLEKKITLWNIQMLSILEKGKTLCLCLELGENTNEVFWNFQDWQEHSIETRLYIRCWCPDGEKGEGRWEERPLKVIQNEKEQDVLVVEPKSGEGSIEYKLIVPSELPCRGENCYVISRMKHYSPKGIILHQQTVFVGIVNK